MPMSKYSWRINCVKDKMLGSFCKKSIGIVSDFKEHSVVQLGDFLPHLNNITRGSSIQDAAEHRIKGQERVNLNRNGEQQRVHVNAWRVGRIRVCNEGGVWGKRKAEWKVKDVSEGMQKRLV